MSIKADVTVFIQNFTADAVFSDTALSFYGPSWEIGLFFGLIPIRGKTKELLRIEYDNIAEVVVGKTSTVINKKDACIIKLKSASENGKNSLPIEIAFKPFDAGCAMLREKVADRFV